MCLSHYLEYWWGSREHVPPIPWPPRLAPEPAHGRSSGNVFPTDFRLKAATSAYCWVSSLQACPANLILGTAHSCVNQFLKINFLICSQLARSLVGSVSLENPDLGQKSTPQITSCVRLPTHMAASASDVTSRKGQLKRGRVTYFSIFVNNLFHTL